MNRLAFTPVLRAARAAHRPCAPRALRAGASSTQPAKVSRRFASTSATAPPPTGSATTTKVTPPSAEFERMLSSLYPGMKTEELAKRVAALYMMTDKKNEIEQVEKKLHAVMRGQDFKPVSERIKHYLKNPPKDIFSSGLAEAWLSPQAEKAFTKAGMNAIDYMTILYESDASVKLIQTLDEAASEQLEQDWVDLKETRDPEILERMLQFYSQRGIDFAPPSPSSLSIAKSMKERSKVDDTPMLTEAEAAELEADPIVFAKKASRDTTFATTTLPDAIPDAPDLMIPDPMLDPKDVVDFPPTADNPFHNRIIVYNHRSVYHNYDESAEMPQDLVDMPEDFEQKLPVAKSYYDGLHQSILIRRGVVQQTGKGKIRRVAYHVLLGNADGLVGLGEGKHANAMVALKSARIDAIRNMDWVERFEKRTVWTEMRTKLGGTELILRPRPVGFGLRCNPYLHQILRAAGFKDISAKVWGSRNRLNVIKAAFRILQAGHAPTGMGDGLGGPGKKLAKGSGLVGKQELERARGRKLISLRK